MDRGRFIIASTPRAASQRAAPDLRRSSIPPARNALVAVLSKGVLRPAGMPSFEDLSDEQITGLQHYVVQQTRAAAGK